MTAKKEESAELETSALLDDCSQDITYSETVNQMIKKATLDSVFEINQLIDAGDVECNDYCFFESKMLEDTNNAIASWNAEMHCVDKSRKIKSYNRLSAYQIAIAIIGLRYCTRIKSPVHKKGEEDLLCFYDSDPDSPSYGTYNSDDKDLADLMRRFDPNMTNANVKDCRSILYSECECQGRRVDETKDPNYIAVNNGIYNKQTKQLMPFSPDYYFLSKVHTNYVENAPMPVFHNESDGTDWDIESAVCDMLPEPGLYDLFWQICAAILQPHVSYGKMLLFYSEVGNNGKGTLCSLFRALLGEENCVSITLQEFGVPFHVAQLLHALAVITDENNVGEYIEVADKLKAAITHDALSVRRMYENPITFNACGLIIQCINEQVCLADKSDSMARRLLVVPFNKSFKGIERKYIKDDYVKRPELLEYILFKALHEIPDFTEFDEPDVCVMALEALRDVTDPVRAFWHEVEAVALWDLLPWRFLYELYKCWFSKNMAGGRYLSFLRFKSRLTAIVQSRSAEFEPTEKCRSDKRMDCPELLIGEYRVDGWVNLYNGGDLVKASTFKQQKQYYAGLKRIEDLKVTEADFDGADLDPIQIKNNARKRHGFPVEDED